MQKRTAWILATAVAAGCGPEGCKPDENKEDSSRADPVLEGLGDGAIISAGPHDVVILVHHTLPYGVAEVDHQLRLATAAVETLDAFHGAATASGQSGMQVAVVEAGDRTGAVSVLTADPPTWRTSLSRLEEYEPRGAVTMDEAVLFALAELVGPRARAAALPVIIHFATRGEALSPDVAEALVGAGVTLAYMGAGPSGLQPQPSRQVVNVMVPRDGDARARLGVILPWRHGGIPLVGRVNDGWGVRLTVLDQEGQVLHRAASTEKRVETVFQWQPQDRGAVITLRVAGTHPQHTDDERFYAATIIPQDTQPAVVGVSPRVVVPGETVTVSGRFFSPNPESNRVEVGVTVTPTTASKNALQFPLPVGAVDGEIRVVVEGSSSAPAELRVDTDGDSIPDNDERAQGTDPNRADTDGDGITDDVDRCPAELVGAGNVGPDGCSLCGDQVLSGSESDLDCGGTCPPCARGKNCRVGTDCSSGACFQQKCLPDYCTDGIHDGDELATDCGGSCAPCGEGAPCVTGADCLSTVCAGNTCRPGACANLVQDDGELGVDCGGPCAGCPVGADCFRNEDCASFICESAVCQAPRCQDGVRNGRETDVDCGGPACPGCLTSKRCVEGGDCRDGICRDNACAAPSCDDVVTNGDETDRDCGGSVCGPCGMGRSCAQNRDCAQGPCVAGSCAAPSCTDTMRNGDETDVDCGGTCNRCGLGKGCGDHEDCVSRSCQEGTCVIPACLDGERDGDETDTDCGGPECARCGTGRGCVVARDCASAICGVDGACVAPTCEDRVRNQGESDADCGGPCGPCANGKGCYVASECESGVCQAGRCAVPTCQDRVKNGEETDVDCGGPCGACGEGRFCAVSTGCVTGECHGGVCVVPRCDDGRKNGNETDLDCGGPCPGCSPSLRCSSASDCQSGICVLGGGLDGGGEWTTCATPSCDDDVRNGGEGDVDCGGGCPACGVDRACQLGTDCASGVCGGTEAQRHCLAPTCEDRVRNGDEVDTDCGGSCPPCGHAMLCTSGTGCLSGVCDLEGAETRCAYPTCTDSVANGHETDTDCGRTCPDLCEDDRGCVGADDCQSGVCKDGACAPASCQDRVKNGEEVGVDCGGGCPGCPAGTTCKQAEDCRSGVCNPRTRACADPVCWDRVKNADETDVDCGGWCNPCGLGKACLVAVDCLSGSCVDGGNGPRCGTSCVDGLRNGEETDRDCGGPSCGSCDLGKACLVARDCGTAGLCSDGACVENTCNDGVRSGLEAGVDCGGVCPDRCAPFSGCSSSSDCGTGWCHRGVCDNAPTCATILRSHPSARSGVYPLRPLGTSVPVDVLCDMETERGGWTLVANAAIAPVQDRGVEYYAGLGSMEGGTPGAGIWQALRETLRESPADVRFTCRVEPAGPSHDVDLSFYAVDWYQQLSVGGDHQSCFLPAGVNSINPARRNNLTGESLVLGTPWVNGNMVGESTCHDPLDFSVDFQDSGVGGDPEDGTDWGADDGFTKCGSNRHAAGTWQVWVREAEVTCVNSVLDEGEEGVDCGGPCAPCPQPCATDDECSGSVCRGGVCVVPRCNDRVMNGTETDVDCGGECSPCELGQMCGTLADCVHGICEAGYCRSGECYNRLKDPLETDVDCGGDCFPCALGMACLVSRDCAEGGCYGLVCALTSCGSSVKDGDETDVDCGGSTCEPCGSGQACLVARDCAEGGCFANLCAATSCGSQVRDGDESDVDCGGTCSPCVDGRVCRGGADCEGGRCADGTCVTLRCDDGVRNDDESDADCGGSCPACRDGLACNADQDCAGGACVGGVCATAFCVDGEISGNETDVDCGGACAPCATGKICSVHGDCASRACVERVCAVMTCANGQLTPGETDVDCGGPDCAPCAGGRLCQVDGDCVSQSCNDGRCLAGHCGNNRWDPGETGVDCGGECYRCPLGQECVGPEDCLSGNCAARLGGGPMTCAPWCGNVEVEPGEDCDDGNGVGGDGCSWDCKTEPMSGDRCNPIGSTPATCGQTCASHGMVANGNWTCVDPFVSLGGCTLGVECVCGCTAVFCGNQAVNQGEECDDGNRRDGDGCDRFCRVEECGDGVWNAGEECDDGNTTVDDGCTGGCTITEGYACRNIPPVSTGATGWGGQAQVGSRDLVWSWSETLNGLRVPATVCGNCAPGSWVEPPGHAQWVNRYGCGLNSPSDADTFYHATFTIPSDTAAAKTVVEALAWADNVVTEIRVNGVVAMVGNPESGFSGPGVYFGAWPSTLYHAGENVITVVVHNGTGFEGLNPDGLLVVTPPVQVVGSLCLLEGSCPEGFADRDQDPGTPCEPCVAGEYCPGGLEPAWTCPPGTFDGDRHPATPCDPCGPGWYCAGGPVDPLLCEGDFFDWDEDPATPCDEAYRVGGEVMGLPGGNEVVVQLNGDETLFLGVDGWFQFWTLLPVGSSYLVTAVGADGGTACTVRNGSGTVTGPVVDVEVQCGL